MQQTDQRLPGVPALSIPGEALVQVEHLTRVITTRVQKTVILDDVSFSVPGRSLFTISGPSGSGKSTLLNMLTGIDRSTSSALCAADLLSDPPHQRNRARADRRGRRGHSSPAYTAHR